MKLEIRWKGTEPSEAVTEHVRQRAMTSLGRLGHSSRTIQKVRVRFEDINGPKGGIDKRCMVQVTGSFGTRVTEAADADFFVAASRAVDMSERAVIRALRSSVIQDSYRGSRSG